MPRTGNRRYPLRPIVGIGALIFRRGNILLIERGKEPLKGYWSLPGGALKTGERLKDGLRREVLEETGLIVEPGEVFEIFERIIPDGKGRAEYHYVLLDYICRVKGGTLAAATDCSNAAWVSRKKLKDYRLTEGTIGVIERAFESYETK